MAEHRHRITWTCEADQALIDGFREGKSIVELCRIIPGKPHFCAVKQRIQRLRKKGVDIPYQQRLHSADAKRAKRLEQIREAKARFEQRHAETEEQARREALDAFAGARFDEDQGAAGAPPCAVKLIPPGLSHRLTYEGMPV